MRVVKRLCLAAMVGALLVAFAPTVGAVACGGIELEGGCLFTVTGGDTPDPDDGFAVTNAHDVPLWDFVQARDLDALGYPISQRWTDGPFTLQAFQKVILQWDPGERRMNFYNTLDALANRYPEVALPFLPAHQVLDADVGADFGTVTRNHLALLEENPAIKQRFLAEPDWLNLYGLPIRYEEREVDGNPRGVQLLRTQRTVFAVWNVPAPGTTIGQVLLQNLPDQVKKLRDVIIPDRVKQPVRDIAPAMRDVDPATAAAIRALPWATDGVGPLEQDAIQHLQAIAHLSPDIFWHLLRDMHLPRETGQIAYKPVHNSPNAPTLRSLALTSQIASIAWIQDGLTDFEQLAARILTDSAFIWPAYVEALLERAWLHDGLTIEERRFLDQMFETLYGDYLFPRNPPKIGQLMAEMVRMPYMDTIEGDEASVWFYLEVAMGYYSFDDQTKLDALEGIVSHLTSKGGVTDDHVLILYLNALNRAFAGSITDIHDPTQFDRYFVESGTGGFTIERRQISLALAGPTQLILVRDGPVSAQMMDVFEESIRVVESHMGVRYPTNRVILGMAEWTGARSFVGSVTLPIRNYPPGDITFSYKATVVHEVAHHYWRGASAWFSEGGADFMEIWTGYVTEDQLPDVRKDCSVDKIADLTGDMSWEVICPYLLGSNLFLDLYKALDEHDFRERIGKYYTMVRDYIVEDRSIIGYLRIRRYFNQGESLDTGDSCDYCDGMEPALYFLRRAFMDGASPEMAHIVNHIISYWYYGPQE